LESFIIVQDRKRFSKGNEIGMVEKTLMTQQEYLDCTGTLCPRCESSDLTGMDSWPDGDYFVYKIVCETCDLTYDEIYTLSRYELTTDGETV